MIEADPVGSFCICGNASELIRDQIAERQREPIGRKPGDRLCWENGKEEVFRFQDIQLQRGFGTFCNRGLPVANGDRKCFVFHRKTERTVA